MSSYSSLSSGTAAANDEPAWYTGSLKDWPWYEVALAVIIMTTLTVFSASCVSHMAATWMLRKDFEVAARSPLLLTLSGCAALVVLLAVVSRGTLAPADVSKMLDGTLTEIVFIPLALTCFTTVYGLRGLRLLIVYKADMRRRWRKVPSELAMFKGVVIVYAVIQVTAWSAGLVFGLHSVTDLALAFILMDMLLTVAACFTLVVKLRKTNDIFYVGAEMRMFGISAFVNLLLSSGIHALDPPGWRYWFIAFLISRYIIPLWLSNIQPIRAVLQARSDDHTHGILSIFPYIPWRSSTKVAIEAKDNKPSTKISEVDVGLEGILKFPPLLQAFEDFCQKALCSESIEFLVEVRNFEKTLKTTASRNDGMEFDTFMGIVDKFIKSNSPFEVNIDDKTRGNVLAKTGTFKELPLGEKLHVLESAKTEIGKMLQENLLHTFRSTQRFKDINDVLVSSNT